MGNTQSVSGDPTTCNNLYSCNKSALPIVMALYLLSITVVGMILKNESAAAGSWVLYAISILVGLAGVVMLFFRKYSFMFSILSVIYGLFLGIAIILSKPENITNYAIAMICAILPSLSGIISGFMWSHNNNICFVQGQQGQSGQF